MTYEELLLKKLGFLEKELLEQLLEQSTIKEFPAGIELVRTGQYVKVIPIVLSGLVKVLTQHEDKEYLLYYIKPSESCVMSLIAGIKRQQSLIEAITETESVLLLIPSDKIEHWIDQYPRLNKLFYQQYEDRYTDMIETVHHLLFDKLDKRIVHYLKEKSETLNQNPIKISHRQIAQDLGTAREVVSRVMKQLERDHLVKQLPDAIQLL
jgi:CRP/FNR family transcriptional regulator